MAFAWTHSGTYRNLPVAIKIVNFDPINVKGRDKMANEVRERTSRLYLLPPLVLLHGPCAKYTRPLSLLHGPAIRGVRNAGT